MDSDYTHISIILDRTGSMESIRDDTIGGFNAFLGEQKKRPERATLTLVQFDTQDPYEVIHQFRPIAEIPELTREAYVPRASTPLLDAIGQGINDLEQRIAGMSQPERPSQVVMVVVTDGQENSSREFRMGQITRMIREKQDLNGWQFVFLSADLAAIEDAMAVGFKQASTLAFDKTAKGTAAAWAAMSTGISGYRSRGVDDVKFTEEDRKEAEAEGKRKK